MYTTQRLVFRALDKEQDIKQITFWMNDPEGQTFLHVGPIAPIDSTGEDLNALFEADKRGGLPWFAICLKPQVPLTSDNYFEELKIAGLLAIRPYSSENIKGLFKNRHVTFGLFIAEELRSQGYGQEALGFLMKYVFEDLAMHRLSLNVRSSNEQAQKLYHRVGFALEGSEPVHSVRAWLKTPAAIGRRRHTHRATDGSWHDTLDMAVLETEYWERKHAKEN